MEIPRSARDSILQMACDASRANRTLRDDVARCAAASGLSDSDMLVLYLCGRGAPVPQKTLGTLLGTSPAQISSVVEKLRLLKLLDAIRDPADRRKQFWQATTSGKNRIQQVEAELRVGTGSKSLSATNRTAQEAA